ncbi:hypothetical protein [Paenibacillus sp. YYML68]|uniref:hypothetical protein n=1 Tax=Paenibacillus sp. YYML68 TaxID=2909250 RepID=UPI00249043C1|nr:hypothetical protein [Paenibacillus sp. YYML68]
MTIEPMKYQYKAFGLQLQSDLQLDGLIQVEGVQNADAVIQLGTVPVSFPGPELENAYYADGTGVFAFRVKGIGSFLIRSGSEILVEPHGDIDPAVLALYVLGTCAGALLLQRGLIPIHGSALSLEGREFIITGHSGAGKSTLTASFNKRGCSFLADDIAALEVTGTSAWIQPAFPKQKLWRDTAIRIFGGIETLERIPGIRDKYHVPMTGPFITESRRLRALFELSVHDKDEVELEEVAGAPKLALIMHHTFRFEMVEALGIQAEHFKKCASISTGIRVFRLKRPRTGFTVDQQMAAINRVMEQFES